MRSVKTSSYSNWCRSPKEVDALVDPRCVEQDLGPTPVGPYIIDWDCEGLTKVAVKITVEQIFLLN